MVFQRLDVRVATHLVLARCLNTYNGAFDLYRFLSDEWGSLKHAMQQRLLIELRTGIRGARCPSLTSLHHRLYRLIILLVTRLEIVVVVAYPLVLVSIT